MVDLLGKQCRDGEVKPSIKELQAGRRVCRCYYSHVISSAIVCMSVKEKAQQSAS